MTPERTPADLREPRPGGGPVRVLAVDPGYTRSAWCIFRGDAIVGLGTDDNLTIARGVTSMAAAVAETVLAVEMVEGMGMQVGREVFRTVLWTGRFLERWTGSRAPVLIPRRTVKLELCGTSRAKDKNVSQAVRDALGEPPTKTRPNPKYPRRPVADEWAAIAVALTYARLVREGRDHELETLDGNAAASAAGKDE